LREDIEVSQTSIIEKSTCSICGRESEIAAKFQGCENRI
jgi:hypothetical protein